MMQPVESLIAVIQVVWVIKYMCLSAPASIQIAVGAMLTYSKYVKHKKKQLTHGNLVWTVMLV